jgi:type I restriction-modification system DNA methylase subunit/GTPase SAR1 family protein
MTKDTYTIKTKQLIDDLKSVCANYGLGNDGNEFKIITQVFLYKFLNDKFLYEVKKLKPELGAINDISTALTKLKKEDFELLMESLNENVPRLKPHQLISYLHNIQNSGDFAITFDDTLREISIENAEIFSIKSFSGAKDLLFGELSAFIFDRTERDAFCRAIINKLFEFSFEESFEFPFEEKYDFFKDIFEYLIKDYYSDSGGKYAEYLTPNAVARIIANILVPEKVKQARCYDPSVGSGSLLMSLAHKIGEDKCTIYTEDISQKSSTMMRLNLIINNLMHSIPNVIKTNTIAQPYYLEKLKFDYIISNPPFKLDFSDFRNDLEKDSFKERFFAGVPNVPNARNESMAIYLLFIQHIMHSLNDNGKAAIVVPTGFITAQSGIEKKIRERLINKGWLLGVVSMPSNIFTSTGTNVSILFLDKKADSEQIVLMDASKLGKIVKEGKSQRTVLTREDEALIVETFNKKESIEDLSVIVTKGQIQEKNFSFSASQYLLVNNLLIENVFNIKCDLLVIPISTKGTISESFGIGLRGMNVSTEAWEGNYELGEVKIINEKQTGRYIAFVCTVDNSYSAYYAIRLIGKRLANKILELVGIKTIATPILGTGAGKLAPHFSLNIMRTAFYENANVKGIGLTFCTLDQEIHYSISNRKLDIITPSSQLVIEADLLKIRTTESIERILYNKEFHFELAIHKFNEFLKFKASTENFYIKIAEQFESKKLAFKEFINSQLSKEQLEFTTLCGELIAYIDYHAYHKNIWNKYPDKRILAKSAVRQNVWFLNLIKFKRTGNLKSLSSSSVKNALIYLKSPEYNLTMLSKNHRKEVFDNIFPNSDEREDLEEEVFMFFRKLGIETQNPNNFGAVCSKILYLPFIKPVWNDSISKEFGFEENIDYTELSMAVSVIEECLSTKSKTLDLGNCGLKDLTIIPELFECTHIEELILSNEWPEYRNGKWRRLTSKNKGGRNNIQFLPDSFCELAELKTLICGGDWNKNGDKEWNRWRISSLTPVTKLKKLEFLNLSNNAITSIIGLNELSNLKEVHLNNNEISEVETLDNLALLNELYLSNNKIEIVDFINKLPSVETLDLHNNLIKDLTPIKRIIEKIGISNNKWELNTLNIAKNPLEQPPMEIVSLGKKAVLGLFEDIEKSGRYINKDIKVILVGNSEVGKSTLVKYLNKETDLEEEHLPTLWMDEQVIKSKYSITTLGEECLLHIFDFGGHDYYHDTHHLFYTTNTIYILLWDKETDKLSFRKSRQNTLEKLEIVIETQDYPIRYWLDSVKFYTKDVQVDNFEFEIKREITYDSSLLVIQNKVDDASKIVFQDNNTLKSEYSFIHDIINISIKPKRNLDHFDSLLLEMLNKMNIIGAVLPKFYEPIKNSISTYDGKPVLTFGEFMSYCNEILQEPINDDQCRRLLKYLAQVGILLCTNNFFEEKIYVDKKWVIKNMHKVLEKLTEQKGEFKRDYVVRILDLDDNYVDDLLSMMQDFKIIFKHPYSDTFIAPLYLPKIPDGKVKLFLNENQIPFRRFEFRGFIHKNVILSIFQQFGTLFPLDKNKDIFYYWKDGLIIKSPHTDEIVMIKFYLGNDEGNACIDIHDLTKNEKPEFPNDVLKYIREVNSGYDLEEMVTLNGKDYISREILEKNATLGKHIFSEKKLADLQNQKQQEKLFKLKDYMEFIENPVKKKKVAISYSKKDVAHAHTLKRYLQPLVDAELIEQPWYCTNLNPGDDWDTKIKHKFQEADIIFFMVSEYFYSTKYIIEYEIKTAIDRYENGENVKIVPIILEFYDWGRKNPYNLQRFSALPYQAKPICDFNNPKIAWNTITASVKMMIEKDLDPAKIEIIGRDLEEIYERQVKGKLDNNSI